MTINALRELLYIRVYGDLNPNFTMKENDVILSYLKQNALIEKGNHKLTNKGVVFLERILNTPMPELSWGYRKDESIDLQPQYRTKLKHNKRKA